MRLSWSPGCPMPDPARHGGAPTVAEPQAAQTGPALVARAHSSGTRSNEQLRHARAWYACIARKGRPLDALGNWQFSGKHRTHRLAGPSSRVSIASLACECSHCMRGALRLDRVLCVHGDACAHRSCTRRGEQMIRSPCPCSAPKMQMPGVQRTGRPPDALPHTLPLPATCRCPVGPGGHPCRLRRSQPER